MHIESGIFVESSNCLLRRSMQIGKRNGEFFFTIESLIQSRIKFSHLEFGNFRQIFRIHFLANFMLMGIFFGRLCLKRLKIFWVFKIRKYLNFKRILRMPRKLIKKEQKSG